MPRGGDNTAPWIELTGVAKRFRTPDGSAFTALTDVDLAVEPGEFCAVVGPSGCGKSTTLTLVSGLERPSEGTVAIHGRPVDGISPEVGFVFQSDALLPWKSVLDNVAAGPIFRGAGERDAHERARDWLRRVGLAGFEDHYPHQLSGGLRKRVALAQSLINEPAILLMDEPFCALDVQTRALMSDELLELWGAVAPAVIFVTHDLEESIALADKRRRHDRCARHRQAGLRHRPAAPAEGAGDPLDPRFIEIYRADLGLAGEEVRRLRPHRRAGRGLTRREPEMSTQVSMPHAAPTSATTEARSRAAAARTLAPQHRRAGAAPRDPRRPDRRVGAVRPRRHHRPLQLRDARRIWDQLSDWVRTAPQAGSLWEQISCTLQEALLGWVIGVVLGVVLRYRARPHPLPRRHVLALHQGAQLDPAHRARARSSSSGSGSGPASKVASAVVLVFFPVFFNAFQGAREVDRNLVANARILGASRPAGDPPGRACPRR